MKNKNQKAYTQNQTLGLKKSVNNLVDNRFKKSVKNLTEKWLQNRSRIGVKIG